jgi:uncharacterized protein YdeI (YjbR/CyaY-like superfamily)
MERFDPRIDAYIDKAADFAKPILNHIRTLVHQASPDVSETIKWGFPHFDYKGTICSMAAFKQHCAFGFWKSKLPSDPHNILQKETSEAMGQLGKLKSISDLPENEVLMSYILEAIDLNERAVKITKKPIDYLPNVNAPQYFSDILSQHPPAKLAFDTFSNYHRREYIQWIEEAKTEATRNKRIAQAIEWLTEGKKRHWKYEQPKS